MGRQLLYSIDMQGGLDVSAPPLSDQSKRTLDEGTWNAIVSGSGFTRPWSGATSQGAGSGSIKLLPFGNTWGGIKSTNYSDKTWTNSDVNVSPDNTLRISNHGYSTGLSCTLSTTGTLPTGLSAATTYYIIRVSNTAVSFATSLANALAGTAITLSGIGSGVGTIDVAETSITGSGSFFQDIGKSRWGIGAGLPHIEGTNVTGFTLSTNLQVQIASSGTYTTPVQAGLAQPSAPTVGIVATAGDVSNSVSAKIERTRPSTGANSVASLASAVITPQANRVRVTFPAASTNQTHWRVFFSFQGFGGTGVHYLATYNGLYDIPETTVSAGTVDGVARSLEFNYKDGDLVPIEASFDDYPPPAATHALRLGTVMNLIGCYSDSVTSPDPGSGVTGTAIAVSKENNYESYIPTSLLFLPEPVVDVLARPIDDYGFIACENSIHAIQYVGDRGDQLAPCTLTTILADIGIQYPHNWCQFRGRLAIYSAQGQLMMMDQGGEFDTDFAAPIAKILKNFSTASTVLGYDPRSDSLLVMNGSRILAFSFQSGQWRQIWLTDYGYSGNALACVSAKRTLYFALDNSGTLTTYTYDTGSATPGISFCSNYQAPNGAAVQDIYELAIAAQTTASTSLIAAINTNLTKTVFRRITTAASGTTITDADSSFSTDMVGKQVAIFGSNIGGGGIDYLITRVSSYSNTAQVVLQNAPQATLTNCLMFVGNFVSSQASFSFAEHLQNFFPNLAEVRSMQVAVWFKATGNVGNVLSIDVMGDEYSSSRAL